VLGIPKLRQEELHHLAVFLFRLSCFLDCGAGVCSSCVKDSGILRDKMKYKDSKNYGTKSSDKNRAGSVSKYELYVLYGYYVVGLRKIRRHLI